MSGKVGGVCLILEDIVLGGHSAGRYFFVHLTIKIYDDGYTFSYQFSKVD